MEEVARAGKVIVNWNGKNITEDIAPFVSSITYTDHEEGASDDISIVLDNTQGLWTGDWYPGEGDTVELYLGYADRLVNCGLFQVDEITASGPPHQMEIKAIASFVTKGMRTKNSRAFEAQTLKQIAQFFCKKYGLTLIDDTSGMLSQINMDRKTQEEKTDLQFLSELGTEYGFLFSIKGEKLVFTTYYNLDNADAVMNISRFQVGSYQITEKTYDTYASGFMNTRNAKKNKALSINVTYTNWSNQNVSEDIALVKGNATTKQQAEQKIKGQLWRKNRFKQAGNLNDLPGDPSLLAGVNFNLIGFGFMSGKYHIPTSSHKISGDGAYTTSLEIRLTGSIPKPQRVPPTKKEKDTYDGQSMDAEENEYQAEENQ